MNLLKLNLSEIQFKYAISQITLNETNIYIKRIVTIEKVQK